MQSFQLARTGTTRHRIAVIEGPNQTNLGRRSKRVYGEIGSLAELQEFCTGIGDELGIEIITFASNFEGSNPSPRLLPSFSLALILNQSFVIQPYGHIAVAWAR